MCSEFGAANALAERFTAAKRKIFDRIYGRLNKEQRDAVYHVRGPLLVLAGAGSGKTTVLTRRIAFIIRYGNAYYADAPSDLTDEYVSELEAIAADGDADICSLEKAADGLARERCPEWAILAITFTNKAANEMKNRLTALLSDPEDAENTEAAENEKRKTDVWAGTFHSVCLRILRKYCTEAGYSSGFTIYDTDDTKKAIQACMRELNIDEKMLAPRAVQNAISRAKDQLITPEKYALEVGQDYTRDRISRIYGLYQKRLREGNALDFDDIIMQTVRLLTENDDIREYYQHRFRYVCVDEYQDTNGAQFELIQLLSGGYRNIMAVGDDDQSIYKFRGAQIGNILNFEKVYKDAAVIRLEQNYRSVGNILDAANALISNNVGRMGKTLRTERESGEKITLKRLENQNEEARYIINRIAELSLREKRKFSDFAVLYRVNAQSNSLENVFARSGIPYRILGGMRFFERKEVKDILAYLCVINNPADNLRLKRIINEPKRKIGETTVAAVEKLAQAEGCSMYEIMRNAHKYTALAKTAQKLSDFAVIIDTLREIARTERLSVLVENTIDRSGYRSMILMMGESEIDRLENIQELVSTAVDYEERIAAQDDGTEPTLTAFLEEIALVADIDNYDARADAVSLMTIHSAKGLEFPVVFLPGFEEGLFPGMQAMVSDEELEEERRLAYVALTRAKDRVYISHVRERLIYGRTAHNQLSRFAKEIPEELISSEILQRQEGHETVPPRPRKKPVVISNELKKRKPSVSYASHGEHFEPGDEVEHASFGRGRILSVTPIATDSLYEVIFDDFGTKKLMGAYARLKRIEG